MELKPETHALLNALNRRQREFVRLLVRDPRKNQRKAYLKAGYEAENGAIADSNASRLMSSEKVAAAYEALLAEYQHKFDVESGAIVEGLARMAFHDPREVLDANGRLLPVDQMDDYAVAGVKELKVERTRVHRAAPVAAQGDAPAEGQREVIEETVEVKFYDRHQALRTLAQVKGLLTTKVEHSGLPNWEKVVAEAGRA